MTQALTAADPVQYSDGWYRYDIPDTPFFINASPKGTSFHVLEAGACPRGMAWTHGKRGSLSAALRFAAELHPSTTDEILDRVAAGLTSQLDIDRVARLRRTGKPGARLWVLPSYEKDGYRGLGEAATSLGLAVLGIESLFGTPPYCWTVRYRTDSGEESTAGGWSVLMLNEALFKWWVTDGKGNLVSGGHWDRQRMEALVTEQFPGAVVEHGSAFVPWEV